MSRRRRGRRGRETGRSRRLNPNVGRMDYAIVVSEGQPPPVDRFHDCRVGLLVDVELVPRKAVEPAEHFQEHGAQEAEILGTCQLAEVIQPEPRFEGGQVDEVASLGPAEDRQDLVDSRFLDIQQEPEVARLSREQAGIGGEVDSRALAAVADDEACEAGRHPLLGHVEARGPEGHLEHGQEPINLPRLHREEVEITGKAVDVTAGDQRTAASQHEVRGLG